MGDQLVAFYDQAAKQLGVQGRMKLALLTGIPSAVAENTPDSPENVKKFEQALAQLKQLPKS